MEALTWDPHTPTCFAISTEDGEVSYFDARKGAGSEPLFRLGAHSKATTALSFCPSIPGLFLTASTDKKIHLWKVDGAAPAQLATADLKVGAVFTAGFCKDAPMLIAAGGAKGTVAVWDTATNANVVNFAESKGVHVPKPLYGTVADGDVGGESLGEDDGSDSDE